MKVNLDKVLHKMYLKNYSLALNSFEIESILYARTRVSNYNILITGLARAGTTSLLNHFHQTGQFASLTYRDMPFLLMPNLWGKRIGFKAKEKSRLHDDGITISSGSPEALDEFFWKAILKDSFYSDSGLACHSPSSVQLQKFSKYIDLICAAYSKRLYLSKNNNSILRLNSLINGGIYNKIIVLFRNPLSHASSLLKVHKKFIKDQQRDSYILEYFNFLGHHEFGLNQKPFLLNKTISDRLLNEDKSELNYWLLSWLNYYSYIQDNYLGKVVFVNFEQICNKPNETFNILSNDIPVSLQFSKLQQFHPNGYTYGVFDYQLFKECNLVYDVLVRNSIPV